MALPIRALAVCVLLTLVLLAPPSAQARGLRLGFLDEVFTGEPDARNVWLGRAVDSGSDFLRLGAGWGSIAPTEPASPTDPADPAYDWGRLDASVKAASARGLSPIISLTGAPRWASGSKRPKGVDPSVWRPRAAAYGAFAQALARRYLGSYPDPEGPGELPRVRAYIPWNEPNMSTYLAPQWAKQNGRLRPASPGIYRGLLNAFARGVKSVYRGNAVVAGATAPFGDYFPGGQRLPPARFLRELLRRRTIFDVLSHHPYSTRGPRARAFNRDDVSVADMGKLRRVLRRAQRAGHVRPRGPKRLWVTELSWDSKPPDPQGVPERRHARWLQEAFYELWRAGVDTITWFQIRDQAPEPSYPLTYQSGVYLRDGTPKLAQRAFYFPFVVDRTSGSTLKAWTRTPAGGRLFIERRRGDRWEIVRRVGVRRHQVVLRGLRAPPGTAFRAVVGGASSLPSRG